MKYLMILLMSLMVLTACDDDVVIVDANGPIITITSPVFSGGGEVFSGDTIYIDVNISDEDEIHEAFYSITQSFEHDAIPAAEVAHMHYHPDLEMLDIDDIYVIDTAHHSNFWLYIEADDHNGNSSRDSVRVHVHS